jgi:hypothetical protein
MAAILFVMKSGFPVSNNPLKFGDNKLWYGHKGREENR